VEKNMSHETNNSIAPEQDPVRTTDTEAAPAQFLVTREVVINQVPYDGTEAGTALVSVGVPSEFRSNLVA
jgi:hypothetical protein